MSVQQPNYVRIFDTTLRDGEQSPGATLSPQEKLRIGRALASLGVDIIEAGFPAASPADQRAVREIAETVGQDDSTPSGEPPTICGLARAMESDIDKCRAAIMGAQKPRIHTFLATSDIHLQYKLQMTRAEALQQLSTMVRYAAMFVSDVEFSAEDAARTDPGFLAEVAEAAVEAGALTFNIPDTVGYAIPEEFGALVRHIVDRVHRVNPAAVVSVHCHDDLGLATANSLAGLQNGARQIEVTINGLGERAGNASLEEMVMILRTRADKLGLFTGVDTTKLCPTSVLVASCTGLAVQANKAVVGANAFSHEAGIHQHGMLCNTETYEIMRPEHVGAAGSKLVLGKHSGRHSFDARLRELGYKLDRDQLLSAFAQFKELADGRKSVDDEDLCRLAKNVLEARKSGADGRTVARPPSTPNRTRID